MQAGDGGELSQVERAVPGLGKLPQVKGKGLRWRGAISGGGELSQVEGRNRWWRGAVSGREQKYLYYIALVLMLYKICYIAYAT